MKDWVDEVACHGGYHTAEKLISQLEAVLVRATMSVVCSWLPARQCFIALDNSVAQETLIRRHGPRIQKTCGVQ